MHVGVRRSHVAASPTVQAQANAKVGRAVGEAGSGFLQVQAGTAAQQHNQLNNRTGCPNPTAGRRRQQPGPGVVRPGCGPAQAGWQ